MKKAFLICLLLFYGVTAFGLTTEDYISQLNAISGTKTLPYLNRPTTQSLWHTPDGIFVIHYDTSGVKAVYGADIDISPVDGIPDYVNRTAEILQESYNVYINQLGFDPPPFDGMEGGDSLYDVYLTEVSGLTSPENPSTQYPERPAYSSFMEIGHDLRVPRYHDDPIPFLKASVSHELFHAIEFSYRAYSRDISPWWFEACASWGEEKVYDNLNDVYYSLQYYLPELQRSLYRTGGQFDYGTWLLPEYLDERFGAAIIKECWQMFASFDFSVTAIDNALIQYNGSFNDEFGKQSVWNYFTSSNYMQGFYEEGASFPVTVHVGRRHDLYPVEWTVAPVDQENISATYIEFVRPELSPGILQIDYDNPTTDRQAVCLVEIGLNSTVSYTINLIHKNGRTRLRVDNFGYDSKVIMIPLWLFEGTMKEGTTTYAYRAFIDSMATSTDYVENQPIKYSLEGAYPNPFNNAVSISFYSPLEESYRFKIYDIVGRLVYSSEGMANQGPTQINWKADENISTGTLLYTIETSFGKLNGKMLFLK